MVLGAVNGSGARIVVGTGTQQMHEFTCAVIGDESHAAVDSERFQQVIDEMHEASGVCRGLVYPPYDLKKPFLVKYRCHNQK